VKVEGTESSTWQLPYFDMVASTRCPGWLLLGSPGVRGTGRAPAAAPSGYGYPAFSRPTSTRIPVFVLPEVAAEIARPIHPVA
jgi:hypothetical protein